MRQTLSTLGIGSAMILATTTLAFAGGGGDDKDKKDKADKSAQASANSGTLEALAQSGQGEEPSKVKVDAKAGSGYTISVGDDFSVNVTNRIQIAWRFDALDNGTDLNNFRIPRARTKLKGNVFDKDTTYQLQVDWVASKLLKDAWLRRTVWADESHDKVSLRVGQQKPKFGKEATISSGALEHPDRSIASRTFAGFRVVGAWLEGSHLDGDKLHWDIGVANADTAGGSSALEGGVEGAANTDNELDYYFGVRLDPFGDMLDEDLKQTDFQHSEQIKGTIGAGLQLGNHQTAVTAPDVDTTCINLNTLWQYQGFQLLGEVFLRSDDTSDGGPKSDHTGWAIGGSYVLAKPERGPQWAGAVRYSVVSNDDPAVLLTKTSGLAGAKGDVSEIQGTITAYSHEHKLKTHFGYTAQQVDPDGVGTSLNHIFEVLFQVVF